MRVERLELVGFKSFSDKTVFKFHPGTTAIVGPNGCGKSNIVDAFKWVLGEQSAKSLRGGSMEDVIFAGSATKKTKGMAEVTLVLSDVVQTSVDSAQGSEKKLPTSISVTRRLFRSGESEYLMNKVPCRLKDIRNMFLDTGLELKAYSILEQGKIGDIVNSKPQDRRFLIEEVAGVMKYKVRKHEAKNKLEASKANLQRLQDIIAEVKRQINTIDRHARKAERYKKLYEEMKDIEVRISKRNFRAFQEEIGGIVASEDALKLREAEVAANVTSAEALTEEKKRVCVEQERSLDEIRTRLYALEREVTEDEGRIALIKSECENYRDRFNYLLMQDKDLIIERETTVETIQEIENSDREMNEELVNLETLLQERNETFSGANNEVREMEQNLEEQRRNLFQKAEEISNARNEVSHLHLNIDNINRKTEKSSQDISNLNDSLSSLTLALSQTKDELEAVKKQVIEEQDAKAQLVNTLNERKRVLTENEESLYREREELAGMNSKLESLKELDDSQRSALDESISTLCQVSDIFETPAEYEKAIEAILGDTLGASIVRDQDEVYRALQLIKDKKARRSGLIPSTLLTGDDHNPAAPGPEPSGEAGVLGRASDFVSVKEGFSGVARSLLNNVLLVDSLSTAFSLWKSTQSAQAGPGHYVTLDGEVLEPTGMVFMGSDKGVLKVKRLMKALEEDIAARKDRIRGIEGGVAALKEEIVNVENDMVSLDGKISGQEKYCHELEVKTANFHDEDGRLRKKHEFIELEITGDQKEKESLQTGLADKEALCRRMEDEKEQIESLIRSIRSEVALKREAMETLNSALTEVKLELTSTREKIAAVTRERERLTAVVVEIDRKTGDMAEERKQIQQSVIEKEQEAVDRDEKLKAKVVLAGEIQGEAAGINDVLEAKRAELELMEKRQKDLSHELEGIHSELNSLEMKKMEKTMKLDYLKEDIMKTYSIDIAAVEVSDTVEEGEEEKMAMLKEKIQKIGPVSLGALDEYEELKTRFEFLTQQRDDLLNAIAALEDTINKINRTSKKRLQEAFEALNEKFKEVFTILFGKGKAELQLTEGSILDAGIEIIAQPPGKRLQNLTLLSGGEKALTALSLLFAGFMIKPTPLCLLDEVDAPLDESNTDRFTRLLKEMSQNIQFIAITHNRRTMEAADYLYGITMEEPGASKVVSMHLAEAV